MAGFVIDRTEIDRRFERTIPDRLQVVSIEAVTEAFRQAAYIVADVCPDSAEKSSAVHALVEAKMWAVQALTRPG